MDEKRDITEEDITIEAVGEIVEKLEEELGPITETEKPITVEDIKLAGNENCKECSGKGWLTTYAPGKYHCNKKKVPKAYGNKFKTIKTRSGEGKVSACNCLIKAIEKYIKTVGKSASKDLKIEPLVINGIKYFVGV